MAGMPYPPTSVRIRAICGRLFSARSFRAFCGNLFPPMDFSLGGYGILPYPRHLLWDILPQNTPNSQNLLLRCPPTDFTDLHRYLGCAVLHRIHRIHRIWQRGYGRDAIPSYICEHPCHLWEALLCQKFLCVPCVLWEYLFSHRIHRIHRICQRVYCRDAIPSYICAHLCHLWESLLCQKFPCVPCVLWESLSSHGIHRIHRIWQRGYGRDAIPSYICAHLWEALLCQKFLCVPCILWEYLFSHGFHRFTQILRVRCSPTECTEYTEFGSVGMAGVPYPPTSVLICAICGSPFSARGSVYSVHSVGASSPFVRLVQQRLLHPLAESTEVSVHILASHPFTSNPAFCMSSQYCGYDFVTTCGSLMRSPGNTIAAGANAIAMRWSS